MTRQPVFFVFHGAPLAHSSNEHLDPLWVAPRILYQSYTYDSRGVAHLRFD